MVVSVIDLTIEVLRRRFWPTDVDLWQEREAEKAKMKSKDDGMILG